MRTASKGRTTTKKEWSWNKPQSSCKEKDEEAVTLKWSRLPEEIQQEEAMRDVKVPWKWMNDWLNKKTRRAMMKSSAVKAEADPHWKKQRNQIKKDMRFLDQMAPFPRKNDMREQRKAEYQVV